MRRRVRAVGAERIPPRRADAEAERTTAPFRVESVRGGVQFAMMTNTPPERLSTGWRSFDQPASPVPAAYARRIRCRHLRIRRPPNGTRTTWPVTAYAVVVPPLALLLIAGVPPACWCLTLASSAQAGDLPALRLRPPRHARPLPRVRRGAACRSFVGIASPPLYFAGRKSLCPVCPNRKADLPTSPARAGSPCHGEYALSRRAPPAAQRGFGGACSRLEVRTHACRTVDRPRRVLADHDPVGCVARRRRRPRCGQGRREPAEPTSTTRSTRITSRARFRS